MPRKALIPLLAVMTAAGLLSGCDSDDGGQSHVVHMTDVGGVGMTEVRVALSDGREVTCLRDRNYGSISCDWEHATTPTTPTTTPTEEAK